MTDALMIAAAECLGITPDEVARLNTPRSELARMVADVQASRGKVAALDLPPGYESGSHELRLPDAHARAMGEGAKWVKPGKGRPAVESPLEKAVTAEEKRRFDVTGNSLRAQSARRAAEAAADANRAKGDKTRAAVESLAAEGKRPDVIAKRVGLKDSRRVNQILVASKKEKSP